MEHSAFGLRPGSVVQDTYRIDALLGEGGMGATFRATNLATGHQVAIKVMSPGFSANRRAVEMFRRESTLLRSVRNEAVIGYETTLMDGEGRLFLVMEFIDGKPLSEYLRRGLRLKSEDVLALGARLAGGLAAIHALGIVHRDIAPDNILIPQDDITEAKLIDFGLASDTIGTDKSIIGDSFAGKLSYCAPEQLGLYGNVARAATDAYALGLVLMKAAGLPVPGEGKGFAALDERRHDVAPPADRISAPLANVLRALLRADPGDRPADLVALFTEARSRPEAKAPAPAKATPPRRTRGAEVPTPKVVPDPVAGTGGGGKRRVILAGGAVLVVAAATLGLLAWQRGPGATALPGADVQMAQEAIAADDPLAAITQLIAQGDGDSLNAALGALLAYQRDALNPVEARQRAAILLARMYDPATFDAASSPFTSPNPSAARRYYQAAADLGSPDARDALTRLQEQE